MTDRQIAALKYLIFQAKDVQDVSKRLVATLIDHSENLTRDVCLTLLADREGFNAEEIRDATYGIDRLISTTGTTHINQLFVAMGVDLVLSLHYGDFDPTRGDEPFNTDGQFSGKSPDMVRSPGLLKTGMPLRYTYWLSRSYYSDTAQLIKITREELEQIDLKRLDF